MPPKEQHNINAECAANFATLTSQMAQVTKNQEQIAIKVFGNGNLGLLQKTEANTRDIAELTQAVKEMVEARRVEAQIKEKELQERKGDTRKWMLGLATTLITTILAVVQTVTIAVMVGK